ncbi:MAG: hypothetical protein KIT09_03215 [Bryobacteraceae bacterium]|nr:hypothetical protein [Bryobacteraceae bacterium]
MSLKILVGLGLAFGCLLPAQEPNPTQKLDEAPAVTTGSSPIYRVNVVSHTTKAVNYGHRASPTEIDMAGTVLMPAAGGEARIRPNRGAVEIEARLNRLDAPQRFGGEYLTYVLWAITPEGRATNLGEIVTDHKDRAKLKTATELQAFALIVTAEPYFAVTQPSDVVVMENAIRPDTRGRIETVDARYELLKRSGYTMDMAAARNGDASAANKVSMKEYESLLALYQGRNAVQLAKANQAATYAGETLAKAEARLQQAETAYARNPEGELVVTAARQAAQIAEDARIIALRKQEANREISSTGFDQGR